MLRLGAIALCSVLIYGCGTMPTTPQNLAGHWALRRTSQPGTYLCLVFSDSNALIGVLDGVGCAQPSPSRTLFATYASPFDGSQIGFAIEDDYYFESLNETSFGYTTYTATLTTPTRFDGTAHLVADEFGIHLDKTYQFTMELIPG